METISDILNTKSGYYCDFGEHVVFVIDEGVINTLPRLAMCGGARILGFSINKKTNEKSSVEVLFSAHLEQTFKGCPKDFKSFGPGMDFPTMYDALAVNMNKDFKPWPVPKDFQPIRFGVYSL